MRSHQNDKGSFSSLLLKLLVLASLVMLLSVGGYAQNAKGDKPVNNKGKVRETRFKSRSKQGDRARTKDIAGRRLRTKNTSSASRASYPQPKATKTKARLRGDKAAKPLGPSFGSRPRDTQRSWKGNRVNVRSSTGKTRNVFPQSGRYNRTSATRPRDTQRAYSNRDQLAWLKRMQSNPDPGKRKRKVMPRSASRAYISKKSINPYTRFARKIKRGDQPRTTDIAGRPLRTRNFETQRPGVIAPTYKPYHNRKRIGDRPYRGAAAGRHVSATRSKPRAWRGDIAGRNIRGRDYQSKVQTGGSGIFKSRTTKPRLGDKPYRRITGGYRSATRPPEKRTGKAPIPVRTPGVGADRIGKYQGNMRLFEARPGVGKQGTDYSGDIRAKRKKKGGKSMSGKRWNNKGTPIPGRTPGIGANKIGRFQGTLKAQRPEKGGGSRSGKLWNNRGVPIVVRTPGAGADRIGKFQGSLKAQRPAKGGGSRSGQLWNNRQTPIPVRTPSLGAARAGKFQGSIKASRPKKGGGSRSGQLWNNNQTPVPVRAPGAASNKIGKFQGNLKASRPKKGGGSRSGQLWNNNQTPVPVRTPSSEAAKAGGYPGNIKRYSRSPGFSDQGEEFTGAIKTRRPKNVSRKYWRGKTADTPVPARLPSESARKSAGFPGNIKRFSRSPGFSDQGEEFTGAIKTRRPKNVSRKYWKGKSPESPVPARLPSESARKAADFPGNIKRFEKSPGFSNQGEEFTGYNKLPRFRRNYLKNPNSAEEALKKARPDNSTYKVGRLYGRVKQHHYVHNRSSAQEALKVREPGKAFAKATDYQGNIRMKKFDLFEKDQRHPDAKFVKVNKNNVAEERDLFTNIKLIWARLFRKGENQPEHLKERERKPRYDNREQGLWYD